MSHIEMLYNCHVLRMGSKITAHRPSRYVDPTSTEKPAAIDLGGGTMNRFLRLVTTATVAFCAITATAQDTTGSITGTVRAPNGALVPGATVTAESPHTGLSRTTTTNTSGGYRIAALPPGPYSLTASLDDLAHHKQMLQVELGGTVNYAVVLEVGAFTDVIEVDAGLPVVDVTSSASGKNLDVGQLDRLLPLNHDTTQIAILVPGTVPGDQKFNPVNQACLTGLCGFNVGWGTPGQDLLSYQGASIAENLYVVDGLNITNFSQGLGSSFIPMAFVDEVRVKSGGLEAEFGRTTGGVVNMVTKSGSNSLRGDAAVWWSPESLQEQSPSTHEWDFEDQVFESTEVTASLGGPLEKDRLFFFLFLRYLEAERTALPNHARYLFEEATPYWGGKLDWNITSRHQLEATYISDDVNADVTRVVSVPEDGLESFYPGSMNRGGNNGILRYTGVLADNFLLSTQVGRNEFARYDTSQGDNCPVSIDKRSGEEVFLGCWVNARAGTWNDTRDAARADVDWFLGSHSLRGGVDVELLTTAVDSEYSGGIRYEYDLAGHDSLFSSLPPDTELVGVFYPGTDSGQFDAESRAAYTQDSWAVSRNLTLNVGLRWESSEYFTAAGTSFIDSGDIAPRLGFVWDASGTGRSKLYGSAGRFHLPYQTMAAARYASSRLTAVDVYFLEGGINPDGSPEDLEDLDPIFTGWVIENGEVREPQAIAADTVEPTSQREFILGFEQLVGSNWTIGIRGVARQYESVIEDVGIDQGLWEAYGVACLDPQNLECGPVFRIANPGDGFEGWFDLDGDGELDPVSLSAEQLGYPDPSRDYYAIELVGSRRFADNWMLEASYIWSHSYGNYEGTARSDWGHIGAGMTTDFEFPGDFNSPGLMDHSSGDLPNDRRHVGRLYGAYSWPWGLGFGGTLFVQSGRPINSFGWHPSEQRAQQYGAASFFTLGEPTPRASMGRTETVWWFDFTVRYDWRLKGAGLFARIDAFNFFNNQGVTNVEERGEVTQGTPYENWGEPIAYQNPRGIRLGLGVSF